MAWQNQLAFSSLTSFSAPMLTAAYGSEDHSLPSVVPTQTNTAQRHGQVNQMSRFAISQSYQATLADVSSAIRHDVDQFLVGLPLGTGPDDAATEEAVACKLYEALLSKAVMQHKLTNW